MSSTPFTQTPANPVGTGRGLRRSAYRFNPSRTLVSKVIDDAARDRMVGVGSAISTFDDVSFERRGEG
jgi:hypothetical protein